MKQIIEQSVRSAIAGLIFARIPANDSFLPPVSAGRTRRCVLLELRFPFKLSRFALCATKVRYLLECQKRFYRPNKACAISERANPTQMVMTKIQKVIGHGDPMRLAWRHIAVCSNDRWRCLCRSYPSPHNCRKRHLKSGPPIGGQSF